jgi:hypothetical protein
VFDSAWGVIPPPPHERKTAWNRGRKFFHCLGAPNNLIRPYQKLWNIVNFLNKMSGVFWSATPRTGPTICTDGFRPERAMVYAVLVPHVRATGWGPPRSNQGAQHGHSVTAPSVDTVRQRGKRLVHGASDCVFDPRFSGKTQCQVWLKVFCQLRSGRSGLSFDVTYWKLYGPDLRRMKLWELHSVVKLYSCLLGYQML